MMSENLVILRHNRATADLTESLAEDLDFLLKDAISLPNLDIECLLIDNWGVTNRILVRMGPNEVINDTRESWVHVDVAVRTAKQEWLNQAHFTLNRTGMSNKATALHLAHLAGDYLKFYAK